MILSRLAAWGLGLAAACLAGLLLVQTLRLADKTAAHAQGLAALHGERAAHERQARTLSERYRELERKHREHIDQIALDTDAAVAAAHADADRARSAHGGLQRELADYLTAHRRSALARAAAGQCAPDAAAIDLLAQLQRSADERAGALALIADESRIRGAACERAWDSARAMSVAAAAATAAGPTAAPAAGPTAEP